MEFDASTATTGPIRRRIYVLAEGAMQSALTEELRSNGYEVLASADPDAVVGEVLHFKPDLVLVQENLSKRAGRHVVLGLRANGQAFPIPVAGVLNDVSVPNLLQWLRVGATDLWRFPFTRETVQRTRELIDECDRSQVQLGTMRTRLLAFTRRAKLSGTVVVWPGTPFEGAATFENGEMQEGRMGSLSGDRALGQLLQLDDGPVIWQEGARTQPLVRAVHQSTFKPKVLLVEDDPALRKLISRQLEVANYVVEAVADGQSGLQLATQKAFDVMIADLDLPRLDGWGLLRELRSDVALRELSVLVLSAHEDAVDTLKVARAGARAYLKKSGKARELLDAVGLLANPRALVSDALAARRTTNVEVRAIGASWLLRALAEYDCQGTLELHDALGRYSVNVSQGHLLTSVATRGSSLMNGHDALRALLTSRGEGHFTFEKTAVPKGVPWLYEALDQTLAAMRRDELVRFKDAVAHPGKLFLNSELAAMFGRTASVNELLVLDGVKSSPDDLVSLAKQLELAPAEVEPILAELLRRGVLSTDP
jgi:DNA-binding response OmpR family regulator